MTFKVIPLVYGSIRPEYSKDFKIIVLNEFKPLFLSFINPVHRLIPSFQCFRFYPACARTSKLALQASEVVRVGRIELPSRPWQGLILPQNHPRLRSDKHRSFGGQARHGAFQDQVIII